MACDRFCRCRNCKPPLIAQAPHKQFSPALPVVLLLVLFWVWVFWRIYKSYYG